MRLSLGRTPEVNGHVETADLALAFQGIDDDLLAERIGQLERRVKNTELVALGLVALVVYLVLFGSK